MTRAATEPASKATRPARSRRTVRPAAQADRPTGTGSADRTGRQAQATGATGTGQADQGPDLDRIWATALDLPPVRQEPATFDFRPTQCFQIHLLMQEAARWGDTAVLRFLNETPDRWPMVWQQLQETEAFLLDCHPAVPTAQVRAAARECCIGWLQFRTLEMGTVREYRTRIGAAWRKLHVGEERLP